MPPPNHTPSKKRIRNKIIVLLISVLLFIPAAELTLRVLCTYCTWTEQNEGYFVSPYKIRNNSWYHVRPVNAVSSYQQQEFDYEIRTNSLGFRDIEHPLIKPPGELRIMAIGDSFTEGQGARFEQTWLNQLGRKLNIEHTGSRFRMISGGAAGSDPFFGYRILEDKLLAYQPDLVLLDINHSDILDVVIRGGMERFLPDGTLKIADHPDMPWLYEHSHFARFIMFELFDYTHLMITHSERDKKAQQALEKTMQLVLDYDALLKSRGIDFTPIIHPFRGELKRNRYDELDLLREFALQHQIDVIDTKPYLYGKLVERGNRLEDLYWPGDNHFTERGYRYFAEAVETGLQPKITRTRAGVSQAGK